MKTQLRHLQNAIDQVTLEHIENNNNPETILAMFKTISKNLNNIRKGRKPYLEGSTKPSSIHPHDEKPVFLEYKRGNSPEYDSQGNKFKRLKRDCKNCGDKCFQSFQTLKKCGFKIEIKEMPDSHLFIRVRDITAKEHGIRKDYKGVYACSICGSEKILDNELEEG
tara:strand:+ start:166 stop:663 length:498 start_codon:yes stop_codon:yes gene_type:complete